MTALKQHSKLAGFFNREWLITEASSGATYKGYQAWHRLYDKEVVAWLATNGAASSEKFLQFLVTKYSDPSLYWRFPEAVQILEHAILNLP